MPRSPSSNTWNRPQGPAPTMTTSAAIGSPAADGLRLNSAPFGLASQRAADAGRLAPAGAGRLLRAARVRVGGGVEVLAFRGQLVDQPPELRHATLGRADRHAVLAARIATGLVGV